MSNSRQSLGRPAGEEMARVLKTAPVRTAPAIDPLQATIDHWRHGALHDVVEPMSDHVLMTYFGTMQRLERRSGRSFAAGTAREGVITIIPAGSSARWDIPGSVDVVQLYLPPLLLDQIAEQAGHSGANGFTGAHRTPGCDRSKASFRCNQIARWRSCDRHFVSPATHLRSCYASPESSHRACFVTRKRSRRAFTVGSSPRNGAPAV